MEDIYFARSKLNATLSQIRKLKTIEFPHKDSYDALVSIENHLLMLGADHDQALEEGSIDAITMVSEMVNKKIIELLPILGHVIRSTNVRNAFEIYAPLLRISKTLLGEETKLLISSEWEYAPFAYPQTHPFLSDFVLIGLPASESSNALIVPLAGHELGHLLWRKERYKTQFIPEIEGHVIEQIIIRWDTYKRLFGTPKRMY